MVMRLIRQQDRERKGIGLNKIELPFFARSKVERDLRSYGDEIFGLHDFLLAHGRTRGQISEPQMREMLATVENGDWLLATDDPFSPLSEDRTGTYRHITGWRMASLDYHPFAQGMLSFPKIEPVASSLPQERSNMAQQFTTRAKATEVDLGQPTALTTISVNDRVATRKAIIRLVRKNGFEFVERTSWGSSSSKKRNAR